MKDLKYFLRDDIYSELIFGVLVLTGPFMSIGLNNNPIVWYVSLAAATCALIGLVARVCYCIRKKTARTESRLTFAFLELLFPYAIVLSALIYDPTGKDISESLWFAAFLCALMVTGYILPDKKSTR